MCWRAPVSLAFTLLDAAMASFLLWRRRGQDVLYAMVLGCVGAQELFQFLLWQEDSLRDAPEADPGACSTASKVYGFGAMYSAFSITLVALWRSYYSQNSYFTAESLQRWRLGALLMWGAQVGLLTFAVAYTGTWCVRVGPHGHQQWICALSLSKLDGGGIDNFPWLTWLYLCWYSMSILMAAATIQVPPVEFVYFSAFQGVTAAIIYIRFLYTSEACSVWCWSGFIFGICAILRPNLEKTQIWKKAEELTNEAALSSSDEDANSPERAKLSPIEVEADAEGGVKESP